MTAPKLTRPRPRTPKQQVLARYPKAEAWLGVNGAVIKTGPRHLSNYYGTFTWEQAWADAARRIRRKP